MQHVNLTILITPHEQIRTVNYAGRIIILLKKGKVRPKTYYKGPEREKTYSSTISLTSPLDSGGRLTPRPGRDDFTLLCENKVEIES